MDWTLIGLFAFAVLLIALAVVHTLYAAHQCRVELSEDKSALFCRMLDHGEAE